MFVMIARRLALGLVTLWLVSAIIFLGVEALPGDACTAMLERDAHGEALDACHKALGLETPALHRYLNWAAGIVQGDFGMSANGHESIAQMVGYRVRNSLLLAAGALAVGIPLAITLGVIAGLRRDRWPDLLFSTGAILAMTIPEFVAATVLILIFAIWLGWVPAIVLTPADAPPLEFFPEVILASAVLTMLMIAHVMRMIRASVIEAMASDYVQMATLKGVPYWRVVFRHALPNALLPAINVIALTVAWLLGGVVVVEVVFNYPGLGRLLIDAISGRDLRVVQAITMIVAATYVAVNLVADLLSLMLNPRLRSHQARRR
ncbi:MAG: ABC transporter permease [Roseovarius sp.]|jgi:peptide/nickel transport system permease protein|nr:ABC transporter permease [Roseovarius sp.]